MQKYALNKIYMNTAPNPEETLSKEISLILICADLSSGLNYRKTVMELVDGCETVLITDPLQVMPELMKGNVDLLLLDVDTTGLDAETIIRQIRDHYAPVAFPVLILSDLAAIEKRNLALAAGANDYLSKPLDSTEVSLRIKNYLALRNYHKASQTLYIDLEREVKKRTAKLDMLIDSALMMSMERSHSNLLSHILLDGKRLLNCDGGTVYLVTQEKSLRFAVRTKEDTLPFQEIPLYDPETGQANEHYVSTYAAIHKKTVIINDVYQETQFDCSGTRSFDLECGCRTVSLLTVPMVPRNGEVIGVLQFINALDPDTGAIIPFPADIVTLMEALAAQAAVALDNLQLVEGQKATMENIIRLLAAAVDSNSGDLFTYFGKKSADREEDFL